MSKARNIADLLDANGDVKSGALDNVPASNDASALTTGTLPDARLSSAIVNQSAFKNLIINGDMSIAQRGTSVTTFNSDAYHTVDRWKNSTAGSISAEFTISQDSDVPTGQGFSNSLKYDCTTANASLGTSTAFRVQTRIEGQNLQYLKKGTSSAESLTMSFWVKSNKTGTYICEFYDANNNRTISKSYTINSASTWEKKTITFAGDTTGAFNNNSGQSLQINFYLFAGTDYTSGTLQTSWGTRVNANRVVGQVNLADSTSNEWYITGIQLEAGTTASDFEFLPHDVNLLRCQRYYQLLGSGDNYPVFNAFYLSSSAIYTVVPTKVTMRTNPSLVQTTGSSYYRFLKEGTSDFFDSISIDESRTNSVELLNSTEVSGTAGQASWVRLNNASSYLAFNAEL
jgi:hypothetical protein